MAGAHRLPGARKRSIGSLMAVLAAMLLVAIAVRAVLGDEGDRSSRPDGRGASSAPQGAAPGKGGGESGTPEAPGSTLPSAARSPSAAPSQHRDPLVIHGTGDVNLDPSYIPNFQTFGYGYAWSGLAGLFQKDDLTVINLECAVSDLGSPAAKEFTFRGDPDALPAARAAGVEVANLGNNHSQDFGVEALLDTRQNLAAHDIAPVGAGADLEEATRPAVLDIKGWRIAVVGFGGVVPTADWLAGPDDPGMASGDDIPTMVTAVRAAEEIADLVIVAIHWGVELDLQPRPEDVERAHAMIDAGADIIFGHHSHRLNPMGTYKGRPIFWSLGNFVWPAFSAAGSATAVAEVAVSANGSLTGRLIPAYIESSGHPVLRGT